MKSLKVLLLLALVSLFSASTSATTLSGTVSYPNATNVTGRLGFRLSQQAALKSTGGCGGPAVIAPSQEVYVTVTSGTVSGTIYGTDCLSPANLYYVVRLLDGQGNVLFTQNWQITGASEDVGTISPIIVPQGTVSIGTAFIDSLIVSGSVSLPSSSFSMPQIFNALTTFNGNVTFSSGSISNLNAGATLNINSGSVVNVNAGSGFSFNMSPNFGFSAVFNESAALGGLVSSSRLWDDSTAHRLKMNNNNGGADTVLGAATTDTLTNKSTTGASNGNNITLLNYQGPLSPVTGTGSAATYYTYSLPANTLATGKCLRIEISSKHSTGSSSASMTLSFGGTSTTGMGDDITSTSAISMMVYKVCNNGGTSVQTMDSKVERGLAGTVFRRFDTAAVNTTSGVTINAQFNVANTDAITPETLTIELVQ